jgi:hypothetical protein
MPWKPSSKMIHCHVANLLTSYAKSFQRNPVLVTAFGKKITNLFKMHKKLSFKDGRRASRGMIYARRMQEGGQGGGKREARRGQGGGKGQGARGKGGRGKGEARRGQAGGISSGEKARGRRWDKLVGSGCKRNRKEARRERDPCYVEKVYDMYSFDQYYTML